MSNKRQRRSPDEDVLVRSYAVTHPPNLHLTGRSFDDWDQLAFAARGVLEVGTEQGTWVAPPHRAVWIPAGVVHQLRMTGRVTVRSLYFRRELGGSRTPVDCRAIAVSPLLRELILHACRCGVLRRPAPADARLAGVLLDQLEEVPAVPLELPMPVDPRARRAATWLLAHPTEPTRAAARQAGAAQRTLERQFVAETGMTLGRWRKRARLLEALRLLAAGQSVTSVALDLGYSTPSAFIAAFRAELGTTPGRHFASPARPTRQTLG